jgi:hypothetical protein
MYDGADQPRRRRFDHFIGQFILVIAILGGGWRRLSMGRGDRGCSPGCLLGLGTPLNRFQFPSPSNSPC